MAAQPAFFPPLIHVTGAGPHHSDRKSKNIILVSVNCTDKLWEHPVGVKGPSFSKLEITQDISKEGAANVF